MNSFFHMLMIRETLQAA